MARAIVVGAGHNGLVAAATLARAGHSVLVLERRDLLGGLAATEEFAPGFRVSSCLHTCEQLDAEVVDALELVSHGLRLLDEPVGVFAPELDGPGLCLPADREAVAAGLGRDAEAYLDYLELLDRIAPLVETLRRATPPLPGSLAPSELLRAWPIGRGFWRVGEKLRAELLRVGPMCAADFLRERFSGDLLCATLAAPGLWWSWMGPWSAGSAATLLLRANAAPRMLLGGGMGNLAEALAASGVAAGAEVRTGVQVDRILVREGRAAGVVAAGEELPAEIVVSGLDPRSTLLCLVGPDHLPPGFAEDLRCLRNRGTTAKVHLALSELPDFTCRPGREPAAHHRGRIHIGAGLDALERAFDGVKYGRLPDEPMLDVLLPSVTDPGLCPGGRHVASIVAHHVPYGADGEILGDRVVAALARHAPNLPGAILHREVLMPQDIDRRFGVTGGHPAHLEHALDQLFFLRPLPGWASYRCPVRGLYLCGMGTHPGGGISGRPGANAAREVLRDH